MELASSMDFKQQRGVLSNPLNKNPILFVVSTYLDCVQLFCYKFNTSTYRTSVAAFSPAHVPEGNANTYQKQESHL